MITKLCTNSKHKISAWLMLNIFFSFDADFHCLDEKIPETFYVWLMACLRAPSLLVVIFIVSPFAGIIAITLVCAFLVIQVNELWFIWFILGHIMFINKINFCSNSILLCEFDTKNYTFAFVLSNNFVFLSEIVSNRMATISTFNSSNELPFIKFTWWHSKRGFKHKGHPILSSFCKPLSVKAWHS